MSAITGQGIVWIWDDERRGMRSDDADGMTIVQLKETFGLPDWDEDAARKAARLPEPSRCRGMSHKQLKRRLE